MTLPGTVLSCRPVPDALENVLQDGHEACSLETHSLVLYGAKSVAMVLCWSLLYLGDKTTGAAQCCTNGPKPSCWALAL